MIDHRLIKACEELTKGTTASLYGAFRFLPSPKREAVFVIYAFCRLTNDSIDEPNNSPYTLDEIKNLFDHLEVAQGHFIWPCLRWLFDTFPLSKQLFYKHMLGQKMDLTLKSYQTLRELDLYCERVAGSVGELLLNVLHDNPSESVKTAGVFLGKAMQIVNMIQDIGEDQSRGRRYLPKEWMDIYEYSLYDFELQVNNSAFKRMIIGLIRLAKYWFETSLADVDTYPEESAFSIKLAAGYYATMMEEVENIGFDVFSKRAIVTDLKKRELYRTVVKEMLKKKSLRVESNVIFLPGTR